MRKPFITFAFKSPLGMTFDLLKDSKNLGSGKARNEYFLEVTALGKG